MKAEKLKRGIARAWAGLCRGVDALRPVARRIEESARIRLAAWRASGTRWTPHVVAMVLVGGGAVACGSFAPPGVGLAVEVGGALVAAAIAAHAVVTLANEHGRREHRRLVLSHTLNRLAPEHGSLLAMKALQVGCALEAEGPSLRALRPLVVHCAGDGVREGVTALVKRAAGSFIPAPVEGFLTVFGVGRAVVAHMLFMVAVEQVARELCVSSLAF